MMETLWNDLRFGARMLLKTPGFTAVAVLSLALGIGGTSTIFSVINTLMFRPLPYEDPNRLVALHEEPPREVRFPRGTSTGNLLDWREQNQSFEQIELIGPGAHSMSMTGGGMAERIRFRYVTPGLFRVLGVQPVVGHTWFPEEEQRGYVVISHEFWQRRFGGDPNVVGQILKTSDLDHTIIGVMPAGFQFFPFAPRVDFWDPVVLSNPNWINRGMKGWFAVARLKSGVTFGQAQAEVETIAQRLAQAYPEANKGWGARIETVGEALFWRYRPVLYPLFGAVVFILLIACANVASLLLSRASRRQREIAVRASLGAGRLRLVRQMLTESLLLSVLGGVVGLLWVRWGIQLTLWLAPSWFPQQAPIDGRVVGFTLGVALLTGILFGLAPAWQASSLRLGESLKEGGRGSGGKSRHRTLDTLVVVEVALALVLLVSAGLMINTFLRLQWVDPGFNPRNLITMEVLLDGDEYFDRLPKRDERHLGQATPRVAMFFKRIVEEINTLPGVESASAIDFFPMQRAYIFSFRIAGELDLPPAERPRAVYNSIAPHFFKTMQVPLKRGRTLSDRDVQESPWVAVINEAMARKHWPDENPIGKVITLDIIEEEKPREIVGVVGNIRHESLSKDPEPAVYVSHLQQPAVYASPSNFRYHKSLVIRTRLGRTGLTSAVRGIVAQADSLQPLYGVQTASQVLSHSMAAHRFYLVLLGGFAGLALILAAMGIYGVISYSVSERTQEIGIRMALGAQTQDVLRLVLIKGGTLALVGIGIGLVGSFAATRVLSSFLYGVEAHDPLTFALVAFVLLGISVVAAYIPARRATRVNPVQALRYE